MRIIRIILFAYLALFIANVHANDRVTISKESKVIKNQITYQDILALKKSGKISATKKAALHYLQKYPKDVDVLLQLSLIYYKEKNYTSAENLLIRIHKITTTYEDANNLLAKIVKIKTQSKKNLSKKYGSKKTTSAKNTIFPDYAQINMLFKQKKLDASKELAIKYLNKYQNDDDVRFILARILIKQNKYAAAKNELYIILSHSKKNKEALMALINLEIEKKHYKFALREISRFYPYANNKLELINLQATIYYLEKRYYKAVSITNVVLKYDNQDKKALKLLKSIKDVNPKYLAGKNEPYFYTLNDHVSDLKQWWNYATFGYARNTDYGRMSLMLNYARRQGRKGFQEEIELTPIINSRVYLDLDATYATNRFLFANYALGQEIFISNPKFLDLSAGNKYYNIGKTYFKRYTGSLSQTLDHTWISFKPFYYVPKLGGTSLLYTVSMRQYFKNPESFFGVTVSLGHSPDLADLQTINFIILRNVIIDTNLQIPLADNKILFSIGSDYQHQVFPNGKVRILNGGSLGLTCRF